MSGHTPVVVRAGATDWARVRDLRLAALRDAPDAFAAELADEAARDEGFWKTRAANPEVFTLLVTLEGRDVGLCVVAAMRDEPRDGGLFAVWVEPEARGRGVGEALVEEAIRRARGAGYRRLVLEVGDHNATAVALYARMGFAPTGKRGAMPSPREHIREHERALSL